MVENMVENMAEKIETMSIEERHKRYLKYLGMDEEIYQETFKWLGIDVKDPYPGVLLDFELTKDKEVRKDLNTVRNMGMLIDPGFLGELRVNGIIVEFVFRLAKKGEVPDRYLRDHFP